MASMQTKIEDGLEILSFPECERLLRLGGVGILALRGDEAPKLRPVNFMTQEKWIMIRTGIGQILEAADRAEPASFVFSQTDAIEHEGFSVVVTGRLVEHREMVGVPYVPLRPWARAEKDNFIGLSMVEVTGRRIASTRLSE